MNLAVILGAIHKGVEVIGMLEKAGQSIAPALQVVKNVVTAGQEHKATAELIEESHRTLDQLIEDFNEPLPPEDE